MINQDYRYTEFCDIKTHTLQEQSLFIYEQDTEDRSVYCCCKLKVNNPTVKFVGVVERGEDKVELIRGGKSMGILEMYDAQGIEDFIRKIKVSSVYLDVTGMNCRVAAPFLKVMLEKKIHVKVVYAEPEDYILEEFQKEGLNKDLSETVNGVMPLPLFVNLMPYDDDSPMFVSLLGFEGGRFHYLVNNQNPSDEKIRPIVGVPGYKMNYPYISLWGNRKVLKLHRCWNHIDYAEANSIVDIYFKLDHIFKKSHRCRMIVAPIGTKPHAIGAIVYAIKHPNEVELLYDNPKRTLHRTKGVGRVSICDVTRLFNE